MIIVLEVALTASLLMTDSVRCSKACQVAEIHEVIERLTQGL